MGTRKDAAVSFLNLAASGRVRESYTKPVGAGFRHHNPFFAGDAQALGQPVPAESVNANGMF